jgi:hypothetical protein
MSPCSRSSSQTTTGPAPPPSSLSRRRPATRCGSAPPWAAPSGEPAFTREFQQIGQAWQDATGIQGTPESVAPTLSAGAASLGAAIGVQVLALVLIFAVVPCFVPAWAAHEGAGRPGVFTSGIRNCQQRGANAAVRSLLQGSVG